MGAAKRFTQNPGNNAICYYRYSSGAQRDVSIDQQREAAHGYAKAHGYHIIKDTLFPAPARTVRSSSRCCMRWRSCARPI